MTLEQPGDASKIRERLLASLVADGSAVLTRYDPAVAELHLASGAEIVLLTCPRDPGELRPFVEPLRKRNRRGTIHVVVVGGLAGDVVPVLEKSAPFWPNPRSGVDHIDPTGAVTRVAGIACPPFKQAVEELSTREPLGDELLAALAAEGARRRDEASRLTSSLQNQRPWATIAIGAVCVALFALGRYWSDGFYSGALGRMGANSGAAVKDGELWRLFASAFLHANVVHLGVNMLALASFGPALERLLGVRRYVILYGLAALGGSLASALLREAGSSVGASGAIWGLMTAGIGLALRPRGLLPPPIIARARRTMMAPLALNLLYSFQPGIDLFAHFGGGIVGFALIWSGVITRGVTPVWTATPEVAPEPDARALKVGVGLISIAMVGSVVISLAIGRPWELRGPLSLEPVRVGDTGLAVELPASLAGSATVRQHGELRIYSYGDLGADPVAVELIVHTLSQAIAPEEMASFIDEQVAVLQELTLPDAVRVGDARRETVADHPFATISHRIDKVALRTWVSAFGDRDVALRIYSGPDRPPSWAGVEDRIVASLGPPTRSKVPSRPTLPPVEAAEWAKCTSKRSTDAVVRIDCGDLHLTHETIRDTPNADLTVLRKELIRLTMENLRKAGFTLSGARPYALAAPAGNAFEFAFEVTDRTGVQRGRGLAATVSTGPTALVDIVCFDPRDAAATPSCAQLAADLAIRGIPEGLVKDAAAPASGTP